MGDSVPSPTAISTPYYRFGRKQIPKSKYFGRQSPKVDTSGELMERNIYLKMVAG
jgi:hypothetical protein